jgi:hypothetical protein
MIINITFKKACYKAEEGFFFSFVIKIGKIRNLTSPYHLKSHWITKISISTDHPLCEELLSSN